MIGTCDNLLESLVIGTCENFRSPTCDNYLWKKVTCENTWDHLAEW